uniref:Uncharacterized protein n=1 Tax=Hyaloperonospora arabidopsidis (strain Emoy2) TaxID=559515 RepID=M4C5Y4_HYAAE
MNSSTDLVFKTMDKLLIENRSDSSKSTTPTVIGVDAGVQPKFTCLPSPAQERAHSVLN